MVLSGFFLSTVSLGVKYLSLQSLTHSAGSQGKFELMSSEKMPRHPDTRGASSPGSRNAGERFFPPICQARLKLQFNSPYLLLYCALRYSEFIQQSSCFEDNYYRTQPDVK